MSKQNVGFHKGKDIPKQKLIKKYFNILKKQNIIRKIGG